MKDVQALWNAWESGDDNAELEATFKIQGHTNWLDVVQHLRSLGLQEEPQPAKLNINAGGLRFTLVGEGIIQKYCNDNVLVGKPFHVQSKERKRVQGAKSEVDWKDYGVRIKLRSEIPLAMDDARVRDVLARWSTIPKFFRYIKRYSFTSLHHKGLRFDLSVVRQNRKTTMGEYVQSVSFASAELSKQPVGYEAEVEMLKGATIKSMMVGIATVLRGLQRSFVLVRDTVRKNVLDFLAKQTGADMGSFPGPQPVTLERQNILPDVTDVANLRTDDYNVTDKADGLRTLLVVMKSGSMYLVDSNMTVYGTDLRLSRDVAAEWGGCVLDGEWVRRDAQNNRVSRFYAFDIYNGKGGQDVSQRPFMVRGTDVAVSRLAAMSEATGVLANAERSIAGIPEHLSLSIHQKTFQTSVNAGDPIGIFKEAASVLDRLKVDPPYHSDGLIFTPNHPSLPKNMGTWRAQFKWKPAEENTIDFLVETEKVRDVDGKSTGVEYVTQKIREDTNEVVTCKTLRLLVGSRTDPALLDPRDTILNNKPLPASKDQGEYRPVEFKPQPPDAMASVCYVPMAVSPVMGSGAGDSSVEVDSNTIRCTRSRDPIVSGSIVEMAYHPTAPPGWRWEPIRVRWDKTERFQTALRTPGRKNFARTMNSDMVANSIWSSIHNPVSEHMIRTGSLEESSSESMPQLPSSNVYYVKKTPARDLYRVRNLREFHNKYIKEDILLSRTLQRGGSLYDMTCGQAGDMHKWTRQGVSFVLGTDIAEMGLVENRDGAYRRYLDQMIQHQGQYPPMIFVQANVSLPLSDGGAGQTPMDRAILRCLWGNEEPTAPPYAQAMKNTASKGFDTVACMFSAHYFFKDAATLDGWLRNIAETLKVGGYFVGCCFDGDSVTNLLSGLATGETRKGTEGDVDVWSITKRYEGDILPASAEGLGWPIDVSFISIGEAYTEYLVSWSYMKQRLGEIGLELLDAEECAQMGLQSSTNLFSESFQMAAHTGRNFHMTPILKQFSFLNRWFILKRKTQGVGLAPVERVLVSVPPARPSPNQPRLVIEEDAAPEMLGEVNGNLGAIPEMEESVPVAPVLPPPVPEPVVKEAEAEEAKPEDEADLAPPAPVPEVEDASGLVLATGPTYKFYHRSEQKDDLGMKDKSWRRWLSTYAPFPLEDLEDSSVVYPTMEAAFTAAKYKYGTNKPQLAAMLFAETGELHQKFERKRLEEKGKLDDKELQELLAEEGDEVRKAAKPADMKRAGAKFDEAAWTAKQEEVIYGYVKQRYEKDARFHAILEKVREKKAKLVFYTSASYNEFSGLEKDGVIFGPNLVGKAMMAAVGLRY
jgi:hypothetical protein